MIPLFKVFMAEDAHAHVEDVLGSGYIGEGPVVRQFEDKLKQWFMVKNLLAVNSCTSAIDLALHLIGIKHGDMVITTPMTCSATNTPILARGAVPVWADVDPVTGLISVASVAKRMQVLGPKVKAIVAVNWAGAPADYMGLRQFGVPIIEDAAHSVGLPPQAHYTCYSFQAIKHLTTGDGGALVVPEYQYARAKRLRWYGLDRDSAKDFRFEQDISEAGFKYTMNDIAASIGLANIVYLPWVLSKHMSAAAFYTTNLKNPAVELPGIIPSSWWLYTIRTPERDKFIAYMTEKGIQTSPVHKRNDQHSAFSRYTQDDLVGVDTFSATEVAIPVGWWLTVDECQHIVDTINSWDPNAA